MRMTSLSATLVVAAVAVAADAPTTAKLFCRLVGEDGKPGSEKEIGAVAVVVSKRLKAAGWDDVQVAPTPSPAQLAVALPAMDATRFAERVKEAWSLIERRGLVEFRIWMENDEEQAERKRRTELGAAYVCDAAFAWIPRAEGGPDMLVRTPEVPARVRMDELRRKGIGETAPAFVEARAAFDQVVREFIFTGDQLARSEVHTEPHVGQVIAYEFKPDRQAAFEALRGKYAPRWVLVVDGKACSTALSCRLPPRERIIEGSGRTGFSESEARDIVAMTQSGPIAGRLVREYEETK